MTICEILENMESNGLTFYEKLPMWMESALFKLISVYGIRTIASYVKDNQMQEFEALIDTIRLAH